MNLNEQPLLLIVNQDVAAPAKPRLGFLEWMSYIKNVNQGNYSAMDRALERLTTYDYETRNRK